MNRRGFLGAILAAGVAPAAIGSGILMPVRLVEPAYVEIEVLRVDLAAQRITRLPADAERITGIISTDSEHIVYTERASYSVEHAALDEYFRVSVAPGGMALTDFGPWGALMVPRDLLGKPIPMRSA